MPCVRWATVITVAVTVPLNAFGAQEATPGQRMVFIGDSITDGNTYPQLVRQALADAGKPVPVCINAAIAGDTARGMRKRLEGDVLTHRPSLVVFSAGINDALHKVPVADYAADVAAVALRLEQAKIPLVILTTTVLGPKHAAADERLAEFNAALRRVAAKSRARVADVNTLMQKARAAKQDVLEADQVHPNYAGHRLIARAVLDALGNTDVAVPEDLRLEAMPGIVKEWRMRAAKDKEKPSDEQSVATLLPDATWTTVRLPQSERQSTWWLDHERRRGFALSLEKIVGPGKSYVGVATVEVDTPRSAFVNTGAQLEAVWLNGKQVFRSAGWTGWHAGKERIPVEFRAGRNAIVIETGPAFFLSITPTNEW